DVADAAGSMAGRPLDRAWLAELVRASGGLPRLVVDAVRAAAARAGIEGIESVPVSELLGAAGDPERGPAGALATVLRRRVALLAPELAALLDALAVHDGSASAGALAATLGIEHAVVHARLAELDSAGWLVPGAAADAHARLPSAAHARALHDALPAARRLA